MKTKMVRICSLSLAVGGLALVSGCAVDQNGHMVLALPAVVVAQPVVYAAPPPVVEEPVMVPDSYVMVDGEYVGLVGDQYFYLGAGGVWLVADPFRVERFHGWERDHADWREHAIRNDNFRRDARGHEQPRRDDRRVQPGQPGHAGQQVQPGHGTPQKPAPKAAPKKKDDKKDDKDAK